LPYNRARREHDSLTVTRFAHPREEKARFERVRAFLFFAE
jgi:hypothetical protein